MYGEPVTTWFSTWSLTFFVVLGGCSAPLQHEYDATMGEDTDVTLFLNEEMGGDSSAPDVDVFDASSDASPNCGSHADCPRGSLCQPAFVGTACNEITGCGLVWGDQVPSDQGCLFDHEYDPFIYAGLSSAAECGSDEECSDSPWGPYCIRRVCHDNPPCEVDEDCQDGYLCFHKTICVDEERVGREM